VRIAADLLDGIAYIHSRGQIYRDLKPDNVIVRPDDHPVLIDFNTAKGFDPDTDGTSAVPGESDTTIPGSFKPPEVRAPHTVDFGQGPWSDVYPVGKLIIGMLRSEGIPRGDAVDPREDTDCPDYLAEVVVTATQYDRADRYNSAQAMRSALERGGSSPPARAQLERLTGPGAVHPLEAGDTVGRAGTEEVTPNIPIEAGGQEEFVSAVQAEFDVSADGQWVLQDRSLNGTWVHKRDHRGWIRVHWADGRRRLRDGGYPAPSGEDGSVPPESIELEDGDIVALADPPRGITFRFSRSDAVTDDGTADPATTGG
jgi:protein kinase/serine/threonine-protein kinase